MYKYLSSVPFQRCFWRQHARGANLPSPNSVHALLPHTLDFPPHNDISHTYLQHASRTTVFTFPQLNDKHPSDCVLSSAARPPVYILNVER